MGFNKGEVVLSFLRSSSWPDVDSHACFTSMLSQKVWVLVALACFLTQIPTLILWHGEV